MLDKCCLDLPEQWPTLAQLSEQVPEILNGAHGNNRGQTSGRIHLQNDFQAVQRWLSKYTRKPATFRSYQKTAERLLLWCIFQIKKPLSSLTAADLAAYLEFIKNPQPAEKWCGTPSENAETWKPFTGPLSISAQQAAYIILHSLMGYLMQCGYLKTNPLLAISNRKKTIKEKSDENSIIVSPTLQIKASILLEDEWKAILKTLAELPEKTIEAQREKYRMQLVVNLLYKLRLRANELAKHKWNDFFENNNQWWFRLTHKNQMVSQLPVDNELLTMIKHYRQLAGETPLPKPEDNRPIFQRWKGKAPLRASQINALLKKLAVKTAIHQFAHSPQKYQKLRAFSAAWLYHFSHEEVPSRR